jgi:hypothetical protein
MSNFQEKSHDAQKAHLEKLAVNSVEDFLYILKNKDCFALQIQYRTLSLLSPFFTIKSNWLTIGDYNGIEANFLKDNGQNATASDISDSFLTEIHKQGFISEYKIVNVERIPFDDNSFDYVFCREAYHHFPRAYLGLYEMIRVAEKAAILIEPIDILSKMPILLFFKNIFDRFSPTFINKIWKNRFSFEPVGNYVFKISEREVEKVAMGIGMSCIAFKGINVFNSHKSYPESREVPLNKKFWNKVIFKLKISDLLCFLTLIPHNSLCSVLFKNLPDESLVNNLKKNGFKVIFLPKNPYLK